MENGNQARGPRANGRRRTVALLAFLPCVAGLLALAGCTPPQAFGAAARAGDTVALMLGVQPDATRANLELALTDAAGAVRTIPAGDAALRAVVQVPPDPLSRAVVERETGAVNGVTQALHEAAQTVPEATFTLAFVDLPADLATGEARIEARVAGTPVAQSPIRIEVLGPGGFPAPWAGSGAEGDSVAWRDALERTAHASVVFEGEGPLSAVEAQITHAVQASGGVHVASITAPGVVNLTYWDDGQILRVMAMSARELPAAPRPAREFGFRLAPVPGTPRLAAFKAYDASGSPTRVRAALVEGRPVFEMTDVVRDATTLTIRGARLCGYCDGTVAGDVGLAVRGAGGEWETLTLLSAQTDTLIATVAPDAPPVEAVRVQTPGGVTERALTH